MTTPRFQKTDSGMKAGYQAIQECYDDCVHIGQKVELIAAELHGKWEGTAAQAFRRNLQAWMQDYDKIVNTLDEIGELVGISDQQMTQVEDEITQLAQHAFNGGNESDRVFQDIIR
ncbi:WXG100 family type VII secretion target [Actinosynnema sp. NPDC020468]|uniref:WXG100 family type VII secretion target n=1 Tax=Actinosynnema sp. NPDC020468 TaxID=3154488 RepID=UPI0033EDFE16